MDDQQWFKDHLDEIKREYEGKLVAVLNGEIIAIGQTLDQIADIVIEKRKRGEISGVPFTGKADDDFAVIHLPPVVL